MLKFIYYWGAYVADPLDMLGWRSRIINEYKRVENKDILLSEVNKTVNAITVFGWALLIGMVIFLVERLIKIIKELK